MTDNDKKLRWEELKTEHLITDQWIDFRRSSYRMPDGKVYEPYYTFTRKSYVVIAARDEAGRYICVRQFRQGIRDITTEFPAGGLEDVDDSSADSLLTQNGSSADAGHTSLLPDQDAALSAARRELLEETGYISDKWTHLLTIPSAATITDTYAVLFLAENCRKAAAQTLDDMEFIEVLTCSDEEISRLIQEGRFQQAIHVLAWHLAKEQLAPNKPDKP